MYKTINLDMDGVLADFNGRIKEITGKTFEEFSNSNLAWNALGKYKDSIYLDLKVLKYADELVNEVFNLANKNNYLVNVLTGIPKRNIIPKAEEHKRIWINKHFPKLFERFKIGPHSEDKWKHCYSNNDILIDDYKKNIIQWREAGGKAILYRTFEAAIEELKNEII